MPSNSFIWTCKKGGGVNFYNLHRIRMMLLYWTKFISSKVYKTFRCGNCLVENWAVWSLKNSLQGFRVWQRSSPHCEINIHVNCIGMVQVSNGHPVFRLYVDFERLSITHTIESEDFPFIFLSQNSFVVFQLGV